MSTNKQRRRAARAEQGVMYVQHMWVIVTFDGTEQDALTSVTVHHDADLVGIHMVSSAVLTASGNVAWLELSQSGNFQGNVNDNPDTLCQQHLYAEGATNWSEDAWLGPLRIPFIAGEKIYINAYGTSTKSAKISVELFWIGR